ncbi:protein-export chaperone SecB [Psittacicella gerlachiana]|uniref:Protein-export protein SecB n=1 Tax=Psittacicella gerlachiana TaxID=2028574 RepID=A0A3A1YMD0_9GAMM|nr:protein-export chaperone SecB [Psittacicella gerlachiana]RIY37177.1 hypothetical protein CKF59_01860 [Psittacicella gerlachiana]
MSEQQTTVELNIHRVYTKDLSYVFNEKNLPVNASPEENAKATEVGFAVDVQVQDLQQDDLVDINVFLNLIIGPHDNPVAKFEIVQGAIYVCRGLPDSVKPQALYFDAAATVWSYITSKLDKLLLRSGMPPLYLGTQNFRAIFQETLAQRQAQQQAQQQA